MKKVVLVLSILLLASFTTQVFAQSKDDVCDGNFSLPSYEDLYGKYFTGVDDQWTYRFSDGTEGKLFYSRKYGKYYVSYYTVYYYYQNFETAMKALYALKKYDCNMDGYIDKND